MKEILTAKLVCEFKAGYGKSAQRYYKLSHPVSKFPNNNFDLLSEIEYKSTILKPEYSYLKKEFENKKDWDIICVSDAHTHIERLVFLGYILNNNYTLFTTRHIDGAHTMLIHGGNSDAVYDDKVYLRRIAAKNNFKFGGIIK